MIDGAAPCVSAPPDFVNDTGIFDLRGAGRHEQRANRAAVRTVVTAYDTRGPVATRMEDSVGVRECGSVGVSWGLRGGVPEAADSPTPSLPHSPTPADLAALEAEERRMAYA